MRRKDREVKGIDAAFDILSRCDTVRIGINGDSAPYVVPMSFGAEMADGKPVVFFHCASQGMKLDLLERDARVCVEGDIFLGIETTEHGITARYESIIGCGVCEIVEDEGEAIHGLRVLTGHYGRGDYPIDRCWGLNHLVVGKITLDTITAKRNLPSQPAADSRETRLYPLIS